MLTASKVMLNQRGVKATFRMNSKGTFMRGSLRLFLFFAAEGTRIFRTPGGVFLLLRRIFGCLRSFFGWYRDERIMAAKFSTIKRP
jgi:hypothetical protein